MRLGPTRTTGRIEGTTSYGEDASCFLKNGFRFSFVGGVASGVLPCRDGPIESDSSPVVEGEWVGEVRVKVVAVVVKGGEREKQRAGE